MLSSILQVKEKEHIVLRKEVILLVVEESLENKKEVELLELETLKIQYLEVEDVFLVLGREAMILK